MSDPEPRRSSGGFRRNEGKTISGTSRLQPDAPETSSCNRAFFARQRDPPAPPYYPAGCGFRPRCRRQRGRPTTGRVPAPLSFPALKNPDFAVVGARRVANFAFFLAPCGATLLDPPRARACAFGAPSCLCTHPKLVKRSSRLRGCDRSTSAIISVKSRRKP